MIGNRSLLALTAALLATGCAGYKISPIDPASLPGGLVGNPATAWGKGYVKDGYIVYAPELYFLLTYSVGSGGAVTASVTPQLLPNTSRPYRITTWNFLAKADFEFTFTDGWKLTALSDKGDNTGVATALIGQVSTLAKAFSPMLAGESGAARTYNSYLLHPRFNEDGVIVGFDNPVRIGPP
jgi:hypothetical protein